MCLLCVSIIKDKLTAKEIARAYMEVTEDHADEVNEVLLQHDPDLIPEIIKELFDIQEKRIS